MIVVAAFMVVVMLILVMVMVMTENRQCMKERNIGERHELYSGMVVTEPKEAGLIS